MAEEIVKNLYGNVYAITNFGVDLKVRASANGNLTKMIIIIVVAVEMRKKPAAFLVSLSIMIRFRSLA